ncbi:MAG: hypothetical protein JW932_20670 [Deltaproteobacteria bacterium]|nr:hypothetical protein [Deltaproteobacteria bacterium]
MRGLWLKKKIFKTESKEKGIEHWATFLCFSIFLFLWLMSYSSPVRAVNKNDRTHGFLTVNTDRKEVAVGGIIELTMAYRLPEGARISGKPKIRGLEGLTIIDQAMDEGRIRIRLLVDHLGSWESGTIELEYVDKDGEKAFLTTEPVSITVISNLGDKPAEARLRPIRDILPTRSVWRSILPWAAVALALIIVAAWFFRWIWKRRNLKSLEPYPEPPHIRAEKEIKALNARQLFEKGQVKMFYFGLSEILRHYVEAIRQFPAAESTTEEIAHYVKHEEDRKLIPLLRQADMVKFADNIPTQTRKDEDIQMALIYIRETSPMPEDKGLDQAKGTRRKAQGF